MQRFKSYNIIIEDVKSKINKLRKLNRDEKKQLIDFFKKNPHKEEEIDWNNKKLNITDFQYIIHSPSKSKTKKLIKKKGIRGLREKIDYIDLSYLFPGYYAYMPLSWEASKHIANNYIGKCTGEWCVAYQKNISYWNSYTENHIFIFLISYDGFEKYALQISNDFKNIKIWNKEDNKIKSVPNINVFSIIKRNKNIINKSWSSVKNQHWIDKALIKNAKYEIINSEEVIWYNGTWEKGTWRDGLWHGGLWIIGNWLGGKWKGGLWKDGTWENGKWENGKWEYGKWEDGTWYNGTWEDGEWEDGTWENGTWVDGVWENGEWENGKWENGKWEDGTWVDGVWEYGKWKDGTWYNGTWEDGIWEYGKWYKGTWNGGIWYDGEWYDGEWYRGRWEDGTWYNGTWEDGEWYDGLWKDGIWENGIWHKGVWKDGTWHDGTWKNGTWVTGNWLGGKWKGGYDQYRNWHEEDDSPDKW